MLQPRPNVSMQTLQVHFSNLALVDDDDSSVLDRPTICTNWYRLWSSFGFSEHQWMSRATKVAEHTQKLFDNKLLAYKEQLAKRRQLVKQLLGDYDELLERTGLSFSIDASAFDALKLKEQEMYIDRKMQELLIQEGQLVQQRKELENKQRSLCTLLNTPPMEFDPSLSISMVDINKKLQGHIKMLCELKDQRLTQVSSYYIKLKEYSERLEWTPTSSQSVVQYLLLEQYDRCLSAGGLNEIESTISQLEGQIESQKARFYKLHSQLEHLYQCLKKDPNKDYCIAFKTGNEHINEFIIKQLEHEIACCREERMRNGKEYCRYVHQQITDLLAKAHLGDADQAVLAKLDFENLSSELLDAYDAELERIVEIYRKRQPVLDAYNKWLSFWNEFAAFIKSSTDPGRFHVRGYNAEIEGRKRRKFQRELPIIEQEFLSVLSEHNDPVFLFEDVPLRQKFDEARQQIPSSLLSSNTPVRTPVASRLLGLTPTKSRTPLNTPRRIVNKAPFLLGTAMTCNAQRTAKTPTTNSAKRVLSKATSKTVGQPLRAKPRPPPPQTVQTPSSPPIANPLPVHPPASAGDQSLDFSLLHTIKNVYGQIKIMTSTPNTSLISTKSQQGKTAHNPIGQRKSARRSKRTALPLLMIQDTDNNTLTSL